MAIRAETGIQQATERGEREAKNFIFKFNRFDEACIACFVPGCDSSIKYGFSELEFDKKTGQIIGSKGVKVPSVLEPDGVSYRANRPNGFSHFSSQMRMVVDLESASLVKSKAKREESTMFIANPDETGLVEAQIFELREMAEALFIKPLIDERYLDRVRMYLGACQRHEFNLRSLQLVTEMKGNIINREILRNSILLEQQVPF